MKYSSDRERELNALTQEMMDLVLLNPNHIDDLRNVLVYHEWKYYIQNDPVISDFEYDQLYKALERLEQECPDLVTPDSPTQRVSSDLTSDFATVPHLTPMLSLANSYNADDLRAFDKSNKKLLGITEEQPLEYCVEPKFDGGSIALIYEDDHLVRAATRGNGQEGDEMTANARTIRSIPLKAAFSISGVRKIELRGEAIIRKDTFESVNRQRAEEGLPVFANPRNAATGGLRMKDPSDTDKRGIEAFVYQISHITKMNGKENHEHVATQWEGMELLQRLGFKVPTVERRLCANIEEVIEFCQEWQQKRDDYPYEIDGMVVKINSINQQRTIGATSHHPRWAIAFKFKAKQATTRLLQVEYQVGKVGSITPVAKVQPVQLAGVTVSSVSLHNEEFITSKDLRLGDQVLVERAGDVIPYIVKAMPDLRDGSEEIISFPATCPLNTEEEIELVKEEGESAWRCPTCTCGAQDLQRIIFHVSKDAMNIDGMGRSIIERFWQEGWIRDSADIYTLDYDLVATLDGFGTRSAQKLKAAIDRSKENPLYRLLHSLSIHHLGKKASKLIAGKIKNVFELCTYSEEDLTEIKDIGPVLAAKVVQAFRDGKMVSMLKRMQLAGVNVDQTGADRPTVLAENAPLSGKTILFTGTLTQMSRKEAQSQAEMLGAKNISAVSGNLDILVVGEKAGSKLRKAQSLGTVDIMTEEAFVSLVESN